MMAKKHRLLRHTKGTTEVYRCWTPRTPSHSPLPLPPQHGTHLHQLLYGAQPARPHQRATQQVAIDDGLAQRLKHQAKHLPGRAHAMHLMSVCMHAEVRPQA